MRSIYDIEGDEQQLANRLRNGENAAMREFYSRYAGYLTAVCARYIVDDEDMKDVFQDCFVNILTHLGDFEFRGAGSLKAWTTKIAVNQALHFLKEKKRAEVMELNRDLPDVIEEDDGPPPVDDIPPDVIHQLVRQLPTGYRTVFNLHVFENRSHEEIAAILGIRKDSSASQLHRAKSLLAKKINEYRESNQ